MKRLSPNDIRIAVNGVALYRAAATTPTERRRSDQLLKRLFKQQMKLHKQR